MHRLMVTHRVLVCLSVLVWVCLPASAITIRADRSDSQYTSLANTILPQGGSVFGSGWVGSGVLISPTWVLTAGHVASGTALTFQNSAGSFSIVQQVAYSGSDIGLARLSSPVSGITPSKLYSLDLGTEPGQAAMISGSGNTGTGLTGQQGGTAGTRRAAETDVYANASAWGWPSTQLLTWFDAPSSGATNLEGGSTQGDSGGGLYLNVNGEWAVAGVLTQAWYGGSGGSVIGMYNTGGVFVRSALYNDWILSYATDAVVIPEPTTSAMVLVVGACLAMRRRR